MVGENGKRQENHLAIKVPYFSKNGCYKSAGIKKKVYCGNYKHNIICMNKGNAMEVNKLSFKKCKSSEPKWHENKKLSCVREQLASSKHWSLNLTAAFKGTECDSKGILESKQVRSGNRIRYFIVLLSIIRYITFGSMTGGYHKW